MVSTVLKDHLKKQKFLKKLVQSRQISDTSPFQSQFFNTISSATEERSVTEKDDESEPHSSQMSQKIGFVEKGRSNLRVRFQLNNQ